ncbi:hypothetical protein DFJ74DRAFT_759967 [Hyaloraphidium curvatum]|nr:hypothetical protein DFJ74DRAFT_759967 [Hyaloraphidium curvatum]
MADPRRPTADPAGTDPAQQAAWRSSVAPSVRSVRSTLDPRGDREGLLGEILRELDGLRDRDDDADSVGTAADDGVGAEWWDAVDDLPLPAAALPEDAAEAPANPFDGPNPFVADTTRHSRASLNPFDADAARLSARLSRVSLNPFDPLVANAAVNAQAHRASVHSAHSAHPEPERRPSRVVVAPPTVPRVRLVEHTVPRLQARPISTAYLPADLRDGFAPPYTDLAPGTPPPVPATAEPVAPVIQAVPVVPFIPAPLPSTPPPSPRPMRSQRVPRMAASLRRIVGSLGISVPPPSQSPAATEDFELAETPSSSPTASPGTPMLPIDGRSLRRTDSFATLVATPSMVAASNPDPEDLFGPGPSNPEAFGAADTDDEASDPSKALHWRTGSTASSASNPPLPYDDDDITAIKARNRASAFLPHAQEDDIDAIKARNRASMLLQQTPEDDIDAIKARNRASLLAEHRMSRASVPGAGRFLDHGTRDSMPLDGLDWAEVAEVKEDKGADEFGLVPVEVVVLEEPKKGKRRMGWVWCCCLLLVLAVLVAAGTTAALLGKNNRELASASMAGAQVGTVVSETTMAQAVDAATSTTATSSQAVEATTAAIVVAAASNTQEPLPSTTQAAASTTEVAPAPPPQATEAAPASQDIPTPSPPAPTPAPGATTPAPEPTSLPPSPLQLGQSCSDSSSCASSCCNAGLCAEWSVCNPPRPAALGEACTHGCESGCCTDGVCAEAAKCVPRPAGLGEGCESDGRCGSGCCREGVCRDVQVCQAPPPPPSPPSPAQNGEQCSASEACASGCCSSGTCAPNEVCKPPPPPPPPSPPSPAELDAACTSGDGCRSGCCSSATCAPHAVCHPPAPAAIGQFCGDSGGCASGCCLSNLCAANEACNPPPPPPPPALAELNAACYAWEACRSGCCRYGSCAERELCFPAQLGQGCSLNEGCTTGCCVRGFCAENAVCFPPPPPPPPPPPMPAENGQPCGEAGCASGCCAGDNRCAAWEVCHPPAAPAPAPAPPPPPPPPSPPSPPAASSSAPQALPSLDGWISGHATYYHACDPAQNHGYSCLGACDNRITDEPSGPPIIALNRQMYRPDMCGNQCVMIFDVQRGIYGTFTVGDACYGCGWGNIDFTAGALSVFGRGPSDGGDFDIHHHLRRICMISFQSLSFDRWNWYEHRDKGPHRELDSTSTQALENENARLRDENAALRIANASLRAQLAASGVAPSAPSPALPTLSPEIVLRIADFFPPGSPTLLRLLQGCKAFYCLLTPHFFREVDLSKVVDAANRVHSFFYGSAAFMDQFLGVPSVPRKFASVKKLRITDPEDALASWQCREVLERCTSIQELEIASRDSEFVCRLLPTDHSGQALANVTKMQVQFPAAEDRQPKIIAFDRTEDVELDLPQLRHLEYTGVLWTPFFAAISECPHLESVHLGIWDLPEDCSGVMPGSLVTKITTWLYGPHLGIRPMRRAFPSAFLPSTVTFVRDWPTDSDSSFMEDWEEILLLPSVKEIELVESSSDCLCLGLLPA